MFKWLFLCFSLILSQISWADSHGVAMHGDPKYAVDQTVDYVNIDAPIGGEIRFAGIGTFDTTNPFVMKGTAPAGLHMMTPNLVFERLCFRSKDEPFSLYGLIAEKIDMAPDRSSITFTLRKDAKWADGKPITTADVAFTHQTLRDKGRANLRLYYKKVKDVKIKDSRTITFTFDPMPDEDRYDPELPLLIGLMVVLPKHALEGKDFERTTMADIPGSGPYKIADLNMGRSIAYKRRDDYWGWGHPKIKGHYNFDRVRYDYYLNDTVAFEGFKTGEYDVRQEADPKKWHHQYNFPAIKNGSVVKREIEHQRPVGLKGFVFNTRRPLFSDIRVRQALASVFDASWVNKTIYQGIMTRTRSYFDNTELASKGPASDSELKVLGEFANQMSMSFLKAEFQPSYFSDQKAYRQELKKADAKLQQAGWGVEKGKRINKATGEVFKFEIMLYNPSDEKLALALARNLKRLGIEATVRVVDTSQYEQRRMNYDYDMILNAWGHSLSPGREQRYYWSSKAADTPGSRNYAGINDPVVDHLCNQLATATTRDDLVASARALDRALLWGNYVIPLFHKNKIYMAHWDKFGHMPYKSDVPIDFTTWWSKDAQKDDAKK